MLLALLPPVAILLGAFGVFVWSANTYPSVRDSDVAYVSSEARLRECPSTKCPSSATYRAGRQLVVLGFVRGEEIRKSDRWVRVEYGDGQRYVHAGLVERAPLPFSSYAELLLLTVMGAGWLLLYRGISSNRLRALAVEDRSSFDLALLGLVLSVGIAFGAVGYIFSQADRQPTIGFLSDAFANLGAGFVGAAVTFGLFQILLSRRAIGASQLDAQLSTLRTEIHAIGRAMERVEANMKPDEADRRAPSRGSAWLRAVGRRVLGPRRR